MQIKLEQVRETMQEELKHAKGNHRSAFLDAIDTRGYDRRTNQYKYWDAVVTQMMVDWSAELN